MALSIEERPAIKVSPLGCWLIHADPTTIQTSPIFKITPEIMYQIAEDVCLPPGRARCRIEVWKHRHKLASLRLTSKFFADLTAGLLSTFKVICPEPQTIKVDLSQNRVQCMIAISRNRLLRYYVKCISLALCKYQCVLCPSIFPERIKNKIFKAGNSEESNRLKTKYSETYGRVWDQGYTNDLDDEQEALANLCKDSHALLITILKKFPYLTELKFHNTPTKPLDKEKHNGLQVRLKGLVAALLNQADLLSLRSLELFGISSGFLSDMTADALNSSSMLKQITTFTLGNSFVDESDGGEKWALALKNMHNLKELSIGHIAGMPEPAIALHTWVEKVLCSQTWQSLEDLTLSSIQVSPKPLIALLKRHKSTLRSVHLCHLAFDSPLKWRKILNYMKNKLDLTEAQVHLSEAEVTYFIASSTDIGAFALMHMIRCRALGLGYSSVYRAEFGNYVLPNQPHDF